MSGFRKAKAEQAALKVGLYGPPGSGKTFTALLCAEGLAKQNGKRIAYIDTERGTDFYCKPGPARKVHPEPFDFDALYTRSLMEAVTEVRKLNLQEHGIIVVDSITHLWEAARLGYQGKTTRIGTIPMHAWGQIKAPYKELMTLLLNSPAHVFICGRQGTEYETDEETEELKAVGVKMKAEGETAYEPHILIRMWCEKQKSGEGVIKAFAEKDRTGTLQGRTIAWPSFDTICKPILPLLGGTQANVASENDVATGDAEKRAEADAEKADASLRILQKFQARITLANTEADLKAIGKEITAEIKKQMVAADVAELRKSYQSAEKRMKGEPVAVVESGDEIPY